MENLGGITLASTSKTFGLFINIIKTNKFMDKKITVPK